MHAREDLHCFEGNFANKGKSDEITGGEKRATLERKPVS